MPPRWQLSLLMEDRHGKPPLHPLTKSFTPPASQSPTPLCSLLQSPYSLPNPELSWRPGLKEGKCNRFLTYQSNLSLSVYFDCRWSVHKAKPAGPCTWMAAAAAAKHWHGGNKAQGWKETLTWQNEQEASWVTRQADWREVWLQRVALEIKVETSWFKEAKKEGSWGGRAGNISGWRCQWRRYILGKIQKWLRRQQDLNGHKWCRAVSGKYRLLGMATGRGFHGAKAVQTS